MVIVHLVSGHFFDSSPPCVSNEISNCLPERRHICNSCIYLTFFLCGHNCLPEGCKVALVTLFEFSPVCFSYVSSNDITGKKQSHTSCICSKFLHCTFSKASSNCQRERRHIRIGCIFLFFLHFVYLNVWSNCLPGRMQGHSCYIWLAFLQCVFQMCPQMA